MANINRVVLVGNLTKDPELRHTPSGTAVCKLRLAVNTRQKDAQTGEWGDKPNYFDITVWGNQGESCAQYLAKGRPVAEVVRLDAPLAARLVLLADVNGQAELADGGAAGRVPELGVARQIPDEHDAIDVCHGETPLLGTSPTPSPLRAAGQALLRPRLPARVRRRTRTRSRSAARSSWSRCASRPGAAARPCGASRRR